MTSSPGSSRPRRVSLAAATAAAAAALLGPVFSADVRAGAVLALTDANQLLAFDTASPGSIDRTVTVSGLEVGETLLGVDFRPATPGVLYGLGSFGTTYQIDPATGAAGPVGPALTAAEAPLRGDLYGFDFNPVVDRVRVVSELGENLRLNPDNGALGGLDANLAYAPGDPNAGFPAGVRAAAYTNNDNDPATATELYGIDSDAGALVLQAPPNEGVLTTVGSLGLEELPLFGGFDITGADNAAFAATSFEPAFGSLDALLATLYGIDLATGRATALGTIGDGSAVVTGLTAVIAGATPPPPPTPNPIPLPPAVLAFPLAAALAGLCHRRARRRAEQA